LSELDGAPFYNRNVLLEIRKVVLLYLLYTI